MVRFFVLAALLPVVVRVAPAQFISFDADPQRPIEAVSAGYFLIDFAFDGDEEPLFSFDFDGPAFGLAYSRPNFLATLAYGEQNADADEEGLRLIDFSLTTWGAAYLAGTGTGPTQLFVPIVLFAHLRRVSPTGRDIPEIEAFNVTVVGLGAGLGLSQALGRGSRFEARAHPGLGLASSAFVESFGSSWLVVADAQLHLGPLFGRYGLSLGYAFRHQVWNINVSDLFPAISDELFDYRSRQHLVRLGLHW